MKPDVCIKTFQARTLAEALSRVRRELGPDAVILETKVTSASLVPWRGTRIHLTASSRSANNAMQETPASSLVEDPELAEKTDSSSNTIHAEAESLSPSPKPIPPVPAPLEWLPDSYLWVADQLRQTDLEPNVIRTWLHDAFAQLGSNVTDPWIIQAHLGQRISAALKVALPLEDWKTSRATVAVVGGSGQGKTSCIAKMAGMASLQCGLRPGILNCSNDGLQAKHSLARYCDLMDWGYEQVHAPKLALAAFERLNECDLILIDTPSCNPGEPEAIEDMQRMLESLAVSQTHWVASANLHPASFHRLQDWYQPLKPTHLLLTKLDESLGLSGLYTGLAHSHLPLGFASTGPGVPDDFLSLNPARVVTLLLGNPPATHSWQRSSIEVQSDTVRMSV